MNNQEIKFKYLFHPYSIKRYKQHYRFLSHAFLHGDYLHLAFNMYTLWMFGPVLEHDIFPYIAGNEFGSNPKLGSLYYILLYTGGIYASTISEYFKNKDNSHYMSLGASGAINALVFSFILVAPTTRIFFIPMPAWMFGILFLGISFYLSKRKTGNESVDRVGHEAHFWGAIFGIVFTGILKPELFPDFITKIIH
jgi:membrane associated rhomboid family serine protease